MILFKFNIFSILFFFFTFNTVLSSIFVIKTNNPVHSVLYLILSFCNVSCIFLLLNAEFLALILLIVYVGAISILFLFVVMMLDIKILTNTLDLSKYIPISLFLIFFFILEIFYFLKQIFYFKNDIIINYNEWILYLDKLTDIETFGQTLYNFYSFFF